MSVGPVNSGKKEKNATPILINQTPPRTSALKSPNRPIEGKNRPVGGSRGGLDGGE